MMKRKLLTTVSPLLVLALVFSLVSVFVMPKPAAAAPAEVWVDDDWAGAGPGDVVDGHSFGTDAFANIKDGIDAVASPGIVHVAAGDYTESIELKDKVQLLGAGAGVSTIDGGLAGSVVTAVGVGPETVLDGFTITAGYAAYGGGMNNTGSSPTVINCTFDNNFAGGGGGMYNFDSSPTVINCTFDNNSAGMGGGMYNHWYSSPTVTNCIFSDNSATLYGGGMHNFQSSPTVASCIFDDNYAFQGGGMYNFDSSPAVASCTFSGNSAGFGSAMRNQDSSPTVANCILWDIGIGEEIFDDGASTPSVTYCDVQGGYPGEGNIDADPMFLDPVGGDYHLQAGSPCIDVGNNTAVPSWLTTDFEGHPRIWDGNGDGEAIVDMGAYEYFTWTCIFQDPARGTELRVSPGDKSFQFIAPGYDSGIVEAEHMIVFRVRRVHLILICHSDSEISLSAFALGCENGFCIAFATDMQTGQTYFLFD